MKFALSPLQKTVAVSLLVAWAIGSYRSGNARNPDLGYVAELSKQGLQQGVSGVVAASGEARKLIGSPEANAADRPQASPQPIAPNLPGNPMEQAIAPPPPVNPTADIARQLGCTTPILANVQPLDAQTYAWWLTRSGGYPKATLATLQNPAPHIATPSACVSADRTQAVWLVMLGPTPQRLVARFDPASQEFRGSELLPLNP